MTVSSPLHRLLPLLAAGTLAVGLAACGSADREGLIPSGDAQSLLDRLDAVSARVADGECGALRDDVSRLRSTAAALPASVDQRLRDRLREGLDNLAGIAPRACEEAAVGAAEAPQEEPPAEPETTTTAIPTTTTPVETAPTTTEEPTVTTPPTSTGELPPGTGGTPVPPEQPGAADPGAGGTEGAG